MVIAARKPQVPLVDTLSTARPFPSKSQYSQSRGQVYFVRHGESTSNERNIFAGVLDVELTAFGRMQARQAGHDLSKKAVQCMCRT